MMGGNAISAGDYCLAIWSEAGLENPAYRLVTFIP